MWNILHDSWLGPCNLWGWGYDTWVVPLALSPPPSATMTITIIITITITIAVTIIIITITITITITIAIAIAIWCTSITTTTPPPPPPRGLFQDVCARCPSTPCSTLRRLFGMKGFRDFQRLQGIWDLGRLMLQVILIQRRSFASSIVCSFLFTHFQSLLRVPEASLRYQHQQVP